MPNINTSSEEITDFPYRFISPFSDDAIIPLYSSIPFDANQSTECLPCVICGNVLQRKAAINQQAAQYGNYIPNQILRKNTTTGFI
jgi:hypothetical protein